MGGAICGGGLESSKSYVSISGKTVRVTNEIYTRINNIIIFSLQYM